MGTETEVYRRQIGMEPHDSRAYLTPGKADHTGELQAMFTRLGSGHYHFGGTINLSLTSGNYATVPSNSVLDFTGAVIVCSNENHTNTNPTGFYFAPSTVDVDVIRPRVKGSAQGVAWSTATLNRQSAAFTIGQSGVTGISRIAFYGLRCKDFYGFPVHAAPGGGSISMVQTTLYNCHNGVNINFDEVTITNFVAYESEGLEMAGARLIVSDYQSYNAKVAGMSIGGWISGGTTRKGGSRLSNIAIYGVERQSESSGGFGILVADAVADMTITSAYVERSQAAGYYIGQLSGGSVNPPKRVTLVGCDAVDCGWNGGGGTESTSRFSFWSTRDNVRFLGCNGQYTTEDATYRPYYHFVVAGANNGITACEGSGGATADVLIRSTATGTMWGGSNRFGSTSKELGASYATATAAP